MKKQFVLWEAIATMVGTIIGAGILGVPYVVAKAGFWTGISVILFLGIISLFLYLYLGEVVLRTKGTHQLTGYAEKYLGKKGKFLMLLSMVGGIYGALIAYILGVGDALAAVFGGDALLYSLGFFIFAGLIVYYGLKWVAESELVMLPFIIFFVLLIGFLSFNHIDLLNFSSFNLAKLFVPYGVILFAFLGSTAIPEMELELKGNTKLMKKAIIIGMLIPLAIYIIFAFVVVGVSGIETTGVGTIGLGEVIGEHMVLIGNLFAVITMTTSFLALGLALKDMYHYDYGLNKKVSWALTCLVPLSIALGGFATFTKALEVSGVLAGGLAGILIVFMTLSAKKIGKRKPEYIVPMNWFIASLFISIFVAGIVFFLF